MFDDLSKLELKISFKLINENIKEFLVKNKIEFDDEYKEYVDFLSNCEHSLEDPKYSPKKPEQARKKSSKKKNTKKKRPSRRSYSYSSSSGDARYYQEREQQAREAQRNWEQQAREAQRKWEQQENFAQYQHHVTFFDGITSQIDKNTEKATTRKLNKFKEYYKKNTSFLTKKSRKKKIIKDFIIDLLADYSKILQILEDEIWNKHKNDYKNKELFSTFLSKTMHHQKISFLDYVICDIIPTTLQLTKKDNKEFRDFFEEQLIDIIARGYNISKKDAKKYLNELKPDSGKHGVRY